MFDRQIQKETEFESNLATFEENSKAKQFKLNIKATK